MESAKEEQNEKAQLSKTLADPTAFYRFENWYPLIQNLTFPSATLNISFEEAEALKKQRENHIMYKQYQRLLNQENNNTSKDNKKKVSENNNNNNTSQTQPVPRELNQTFREIEKKLDGLIQGKDAFVKLSTRSPKDSGITSEKIKQIISQDFESLTKPQNEIEERNQDIFLFVRAGIFALKVNSGKEALELLLNSQRVYEDLTRLTLYNESPENWELSFIVRQWVPIEPQWEMRCFVFGGEITAISQYYNICYVPEIYNQKEKIEQYIQQYFKNVASPKIPEKNYTLDLALDPELKKDPWIIEINHSAPTAGTALFDWDNPEDQNIVKSGPFTLRLTPPPQPPLQPLSQVIHPPVAYHIDLLRGRDITVPSLAFLSCDFCHSGTSLAWKRCRKCFQDKCDKEKCQACSCQAGWANVVEETKKNEQTKSPEKAVSVKKKSDCWKHI